MIDETRETVERLTAPIDHDALRAQRGETGGAPLRPDLSVKPSHGFRRSKCCGEPLYVAGEGPTHWYACSSCGEPQ